MHEKKVKVLFLYMSWISLLTVGEGQNVFCNHSRDHCFYSSYCKYWYRRDVYYNNVRQKTALEKQIKYFSFLFIFYVIKNFSEEMARGTSELIRRFCLFSFKRRSSSPSSTSTSDNSESEEEKKVGTWPNWLVRIKLRQVTTCPWNSVIRLLKAQNCDWYSRQCN